MNEQIQLSSPWLDERESDRIARALAGRIGGDGPFCRKVEDRLAKRLQARHALLTTSCTHALELALLALGIGRGDEVIVPSFTFASTANAVLRVGATPVFADLEEESLALDPADVERRLTGRTAALLPVHYAGMAGPMGPLLEIASRRSLRVVEDAAQGFDAAWNGRPLGSIGDAGCLSFHETKNITCGEGGALLLRDDDVARRAEIIREKGTNRAAFLRGEVDKYTWVAEGSSYVLSDVLAAILDAQLDKADEIARRRGRVAARYRAALADWAVDRGVRLPARFHPDVRRTTTSSICATLPGQPATGGSTTSGRAASRRASTTCRFTRLHVDGPWRRASSRSPTESPPPSSACPSIPCSWTARSTA